MPPPIFGESGQLVSFKNHSVNHHQLPHPRLLAVHAALAEIAELSAAGSYVEKILREADEIQVLSPDGSTNIEIIFASRGFLVACGGP